MSDLKENLKKFIKPLKEHPTCVMNVLLLAAITGFEQGFEFSVFECPKEHNNVKWYSMVMMFMPAIALFVVGILCSNKAWRLCQGMNSRPERQKCRNACGPCCGNFCNICLRALIIPFSWFFVVLMDGDLFVCHQWKPKCTEQLIRDGVDCTEDPESWDKHNKTQSQLCAWYFLAGCLILGIIAVCVNRCCSSKFYFPHIYSSTLKRSERMHLETLLKEKAKADAEHHIKALIWHEPKMTAENWESVCREHTSEPQTEVPPKDGGNNSQTASENLVQLHSGIHQYLVENKVLEEYNKKIAEEEKKKKQEEEKKKQGQQSSGGNPAPGGQQVVAATGGQQVVAATGRQQNKEKGETPPVSSANKQGN